MTRFDLPQSVHDTVYKGDDTLRAIPMGRSGQPIEVAKAIVFLASPDASYINGVDLPVDGGVLAWCG